MLHGARYGDKPPARAVIENYGPVGVRVKSWVHIAALKVNVGFD